MRPEYLSSPPPTLPNYSQPTPYATLHPNHPDLAVSFGQATFDAEGVESSGPYFSRVMHWPGGASGVTIGRGYDMGQRTRLQVISELRHAGVSEEDALFLAGAAGLRGERAGRHVAAHLSESPILSLSSQRRLFETITTPEIISDIQRILAKPDLRAKYGAISWDALTPIAREVVFDLRYRGDYTPETRTRLQPLLVARDDEGLAKLLTDQSYWIQRGVPAGRVNARTELINNWEGFRMAS